MLEPLVHSHVARALRERRPVVALESTIITHGMPYPTNLETARRAEAAVRVAGAVPATIALVDGTVCVGLDDPQLLRLASAGDVGKASLHNLPVLAASGACAGTTVAATLAVAARVGLRVFASGGIGGVHRGAASTFDISSDLVALSRYPLVVVCSGAKSLLDLAATREALETLGVAILGYDTADLPAFVLRKSDLPVDARLSAPSDVAAVVHMRDALGLSAALLVVVPVPPDQAVDSATFEHAMQTALAEAEARRVRGKDVTPFLLHRLDEHTGGASLRANVALMEVNARVAAQIAIALASDSAEEATT